MLLDEFDTLSCGPLAGREGIGDVLRFLLGLTRAGAGLAAGRTGPAALDTAPLIGLMLSAVAIDIRLERMGLAVGRGEPFGRPLLGLLCPWVTRNEEELELFRVDEIVDRTPGDARAPDRMRPLLELCRGWGLMAGRVPGVVPG